MARGIMAAVRASPEEFRFIGVDSSKYHIHQSEADELHLVPRADDASYVDAVDHIAKTTGADFIWPMHDAEVARLSEASDNLSARTWLPPYEVVEVCQGKFATHERLKQADVPVPETLFVNNRSDLETAFDLFGDDVWLRADRGAGAKGAFRASSLDHATFWLDINDGWGGFTASEYLPGPGDYSWESIWKDGQLVAGQVEKRLVRPSPGISLGGVRSRGVYQRDAPPKVDTTAEQAVRAVMTEPDGIFRVDLMADASGAPRVTEVDAGRFGTGGAIYWHEFGYNWAYQAFRLGMGEPIDHSVPVINPCPKDVVSIGGVNRSLMFVNLSDVESLHAEYRELIESLRVADH